MEAQEINKYLNDAYSELDKTKIEMEGFIWHDWLNRYDTKLFLKLLVNMKICMQNRISNESHESPEFIKALTYKIGQHNQIDELLNYIEELKNKEKVKDEENN